MTERMTLTSESVLAQRMEQLRETFPEVFTEGKVDFEKLKEALGEEVAAERERYGLSWAGKGEAVRNVQTPSVGTLTPDRGESVEFDASENLFIEGDNLEVLKLLQKSYHGRVKMIYIDPPYNTGNEFIYPDNFREGLEDYLRYSGQVNGEGMKLSTNTETSGRYHSAWLNMMYPRLFLARNLLREDGVIFISIDDHEVHNLRMLMDEVFGEENFLASIVWKHTQQSKNDERYFSRHHNNILSYRRGEELPPFRLGRTQEDNKAYSNPDNDPRGDWRSGDVRSPNYRATLRFPVATPSGKTIDPPENGWRWKEETLLTKLETGEVIFSPDETRIIRKIYLADQEGRTPENVWLHDVAGTTRHANSEIKELFGYAAFDTAKPIALIKRMLELATVRETEDIVLDFFAGSASMAHAVLELNKEDSGNRKFIMVQLPEPTDNPDYPTIADIGKERIRRVIEKLNAEDEGRLRAEDEPPQDRGFKVFKLASSNFKIWDGVEAGEAGEPEELAEQLAAFADNVKPDRGREEILYEILLKAGFPLTAPIEPVEVAGEEVYAVAEGALLVCLAESVGEELLRGMMELEPVRVVCLDTAFHGNDRLKTNAVLEMKDRGIEFRTV